VVVHLFMTVFILLFGTPEKEEKVTGFSLWIPDIRANTLIPRKYTCEGDNVSPEIHFENVPHRTRSIALVMEDSIDFITNWLIYNIPPDSMLHSGVPSEFKVGSMCQGKNGLGQFGYSGPCPPSGTHYYDFTAYALDTVLECDEDMNVHSFRRIIEGHVLATYSLRGLYWTEQNTEPCVKVSIWQKIMDFFKTWR